MKLTVLGSGTVISGQEKAAAGFALEIGKKTIVVDLGFGSFKNLQRAGFDYIKVNDLFFTHFEHIDHVNDLPAFLFARKISIYFGFSKPTQVNVFGGPGFKAFMKNLFTVYPILDNTLFKLNISELSSFATKKFSGFTLTTKPMKHEPSSLGLRFEADKKSIVFAGDTGPNQNIASLAKDTDLLVVECSFAARKMGNHLNAGQVAEIASKANAKAVLLTHFYPEAEKADIKALVSKKFNGKVLIAKDLMQVSI